MSSHASCIEMVKVAKVQLDFVKFLCVCPVHWTLALSTAFATAAVCSLSLCLFLLHLSSLLSDVLRSPLTSAAPWGYILFLPFLLLPMSQ